MLIPIRINFALANFFALCIHKVVHSTASLLNNFCQVLIAFGNFFPDFICFLLGFWWTCIGFPDWFLEGIRDDDKVKIKDKEQCFCYLHALLWFLCYLTYFAIYANALLASAILCASSFFLTAFPWLEYAAKSSSERAIYIGDHFFALAISIIHFDQ